MFILKIFTDVENLTNKANKIGNLILRHAPFLDGFSYDRFEEKGGMNLWVFTRKFTDYTFRIIFGEKNDRWKSKIFVYWKQKTNSPTLGAGKDFEYKIGPFNNLDELVTSMNKTLKNNPIMGQHLYDDDFELNMDKEALPLLKKLKQSGEKLMAINDGYFDDLKKIYKKVKNIPEDKLVHYCSITNKKEADKQDFLLDLQKIHKLDFYDGMRSMGHLTT